MKLIKQLLKTDSTFAPLVLRIALGLVIFPHGAQKVLGWFGGHGLEGTFGFLTHQMGLPMVIAALVIGGEFLGSLALISGLFTRLSAFGILSIMAGAAITVHWGNGFFMNWSGQQGGEGFEFHLLAMAMAASLMITGGGKFSLDQWISGKFLNLSRAGSPSGPLALSTH